MNIWKMDRDTTNHIIKHVKVGDKIPLENCEKCGADYIKELGHRCDNVIELECEEADGTEKIEAL